MAVNSCCKTPEASCYYGSMLGSSLYMTGSYVAIATYFSSSLVSTRSTCNHYIVLNFQNHFMTNCIGMRMRCRDSMLLFVVSAVYFELLRPDCIASLYLDHVAISMRQLSYKI